MAIQQRNLPYATAVEWLGEQELPTQEQLLDNPPTHEGWFWTKATNSPTVTTQIHFPSKKPRMEAMSQMGWATKVIAEKPKYSNKIKDEK